MVPESESASLDPQVVAAQVGEMGFVDAVRPE